MIKVLGAFNSLEDRVARIKTEIMTIHQRVASFIMKTRESHRGLRDGISAILSTLIRPSFGSVPNTSTPADSTLVPPAPGPVMDDDDDVTDSNEFDFPYLMIELVSEIAADPPRSPIHDPLIHPSTLLSYPHLLLD